MFENSEQYEPQPEKTGVDEAEDMACVDEKKVQAYECVNVAFAEHMATHTSMRTSWMLHEHIW